MTESLYNSGVKFWLTSILEGYVNVHSMEPTFLLLNPRMNRAYSQGPK